MQTLQETLRPSYISIEKKQSLVSQFISWCTRQEKYRYGWLAVIIAFHGCAFTPVTGFLIALSGNNIVLWAVAIGAMAMALITNLAAMPTKITIPVFFFSLIIDLAIIGISLYNIFFGPGASNIF